MGFGRFENVDDGKETMKGIGDLLIATLRQRFVSQPFDIATNILHGQMRRLISGQNIPVLNRRESGRKVLMVAGKGVLRCGALLLVKTQLFGGMRCVAGGSERGNHRTAFFGIALHDFEGVQIVIQLAQGLVAIALMRP